MRKKKTRRGLNNKNHNIKIFSTNANGLRLKKNSFKNKIDSENIKMFTIQETLLKSKEKFFLENFDIFEAFRSKEGGGSMIGVHSSLESKLIAEYNVDFELLVVEVNDDRKHIRVITGYGPQETINEN